MSSPHGTLKMTAAIQGDLALEAEPQEISSQRKEEPVGPSGSRPARKKKASEHHTREPTKRASKATERDESRRQRALDRKIAKAQRKADRAKDQGPTGRVIPHPFPLQPLELTRPRDSPHHPMIARMVTRQCRGTAFAFCLQSAWRLWEFLQLPARAWISDNCQGAASEMKVFICSSNLRYHCCRPPLSGTCRSSTTS